MKGLNSRAFWKISLLADFGHFMEMSLNFIPLHLGFGFCSTNAILVLLDSKFAIIMLCYDFIVKNVQSSSELKITIILRQNGWLWLWLYNHYNQNNHNNHNHITILIMVKMVIWPPEILIKISKKILKVRKVKEIWQKAHSVWPGIIQIFVVLPEPLLLAK